MSIWKNSLLTERVPFFRLLNCPECFITKRKVLVSAILNNIFINICDFFHTKDSGISFDAGDFLNFDLEMSKPKDEPPAKKKKGESNDKI